MPRLPKKVVHLKALSRVKEDAYRRVLDAVGLKRRNPALSLSAAAKRSGTTLRTVHKYAESALEVRSGRLDVKTTDRLPRPMRFLTDRGEIVVRVTSSRAASRIARYNNAVRALVVSLDNSGLKAFEGKSIRAGGRVYPFITDPGTIMRLARAGALHFMDIYAPGATS